MLMLLIDCLKRVLNIIVISLDYTNLFWSHTAWVDIDHDLQKHYAGTYCSTIREFLWL